jgi:curved DNA-binding protein CbpA
MSLDPYIELGVPRDADPAAIKAAHRRKIKKAHPDAGGSPDEFDRAQRSYLVLSDPDRRAHYDRTGQTETESAAAHKARVVNELLSIISQIVEQEALDLEHTDILQTIRTSINGVLGKIAQELAATKSKVARLDRLEKRLKPKGKKNGAAEETATSAIMALALRQQRSNLETHIDMTQKAEELHKQMLAVFDAFRYEFEPRTTAQQSGIYGNLSDEVMRQIFRPPPFFHTSST